jgi:hypothetical protein
LPASAALPITSEARTIVNYTANQTQTSSRPDGMARQRSRNHFVLDNLLDPPARAFRTSLLAITGGAWMCY